MTFSQFGQTVAALANSLSRSGVQRGDAVAIISNSRAEWCVADMAIQALGGITVGIYQSLSASEIAYVLHHSGAEHVIAENEEQLKKLEHISRNQIEIPEDERGPKQLVQLAFKSLYSFELAECAIPYTFLEELFSGNQKYDRPSSPGTSENDIASLVYTSGTTGTPKGVVQRHGNHLANIRQICETDILPSDIDHPTIFLYLPLAHSFGRTMSYLALLSRCIMHFPSIADSKSSRLDLTLISQDLSSSDANIVPTVPRLLEKARTGIISKSNSKGLLGSLIKTTLAAAEAVYRADGTCTFKERITFILTRPLRKLLAKKLFGKEFRFAIIGGAKLPIHVGAFFNGLEIPSFEGYGLTETCVVTNVNTPKFQRLGSIGKVLSNIELKIAEDGELLFRGPNICNGYWQAPTATAEAWDDNGWFHTGDIGTIDDDGFVFITDRKKELLVTAGGKKIPPQKIEVLLKQLPLISQAVLTGEGRQYCSALLTLNHQSVIEWAAGRTVLPKLNDWKELRAELQKHLDQVNSSLASYETVKNFYILDGDFSIDNGLLTPTLKVKRKLVINRYKDEISSMY
jgi:long-chain acyl-CoA synthetase